MPQVDFSRGRPVESSHACPRACRKSVEEALCELFRWARRQLLAVQRFAYDRLFADRAPRRSRFGLRLVLISDTHGCHRKMSVPEGDVLIHAGDFTLMGRESDVTDFNDWLGALPHKHKLVVNGNHECNASWKALVGERLTNATFLRDSAVTLPDSGLRVHGTEFAWPMKSRNPIYEAIAAEASEAEGVDVLVCHGPVQGYVDDDRGCAELLRLVHRIRPRLVVSGHIHNAHGVEEGRGGLRGTTFVNAANARNSHTTLGWPPVVVDM